MRALVCGGRDFNDRATLCAWLNAYHKLYSITVIIHGGARGADSLAGEWADNEGVPTQVYRADWKAHGNRAGPIRNALMLKEGKPTVVIAFEGGRGTAHMVSLAEGAKVPVLRPIAGGILPQRQGTPQEHVGAQ